MNFTGIRYSIKSPQKNINKTPFVLTHKCSHVLESKDLGKQCHRCGFMLENQLQPYAESGYRAPTSYEDRDSYSRKSYGGDPDTKDRYYNSSYHHQYRDHENVSSKDDRNLRFQNDSRRDQEYDESNNNIDSSSFHRDSYSSRHFRDEEDRDRYASRYRHSNHHYREDGPRYRDDKRRRTDYYENHYQEDEPNYYQDRPQRRDQVNNNNNNNRRSRVKDREWPPSFESSGASYIFDNRSGLFYEVSSNFFYDPKTKLYFGNKQQKYYQYVPESNPPFQEVMGHSTSDALVGSGDSTLDGSSNRPSFGMNVFPFSQIPLQDTAASDDLVIKALGGGSHAMTHQELSGTTGKKKKIAISLKKSVDSTVPSDSTQGENVGTANVTENIQVETMNVKEKETTNELDSVLISSKLHKLHEADMDKWSQRGHDLKHHELYASTEATEAKQVKLTISGQPICLICKRKFASLEKLKHHEQLSDLHKQNLTKLASNNISAMTEDVGEVTQYRDRALERRILYPDSHITVLQSALTDTNVSSDRTDQRQPSQILNEEHVGNKMLQKLGWTGGSLGKSDVETNLEDDSKKKVVSTKLREDWERIEMLSTKRD